MSELNITVIQNPEDNCISMVHELFAKEFGKEELEPVEVFRREIKLTASGEHDAPYILIVTLMGGRVVGGLSGNYLRVDRAIAAGAIGYCVVASDVRGRGIGRAMVDRFLEYLFVYSSEEGRSLNSVVLEAQIPSNKHPSFYDSIPFWAKLGWRFPEGAKYYQPSLKFNNDGEPEFDPVPLAFMIRQLNGEDHIRRQEIQDITKTLFDRWYIPNKNDFDEDAYQHACRHVYGLLGAFLQTLKVQDDGNVSLIHLTLDKQKGQ